MKSKESTPEVDRPVAKDRSLPILIGAGILALLANLTFYLTYPINAGQSDNPTFMSMIISGLPNLMHASGYPAIVHFLAYKILPILPPVAALNQAPSDQWFNSLQTFQLVAHLALFSISIYLCAKTFGKSSATVLALGWGCNALFISNVDSIAPEWLQGHALILSVLLHAYARKLDARKKILVYCLAAGAFGFAYLIKPNSLLFAISLVAFLLFDNESVRFKAAQMAGSVAICLLVIWAYVSFYHYEATGTRQLNFDHAWVLTAALPETYETASPEQLGVNSLRWAVLVRITPPEYFRAGGVDSIRFGPPPEIRQQFEEQMGYILRMSREEMIQYVKGHPLPAEYSHWASAVPLYYYYGLERIDALGIDVYLESIRSHPWYHFRKIANTLATFFVSGLKSIQTFPTFRDTLGFQFLPPDFSSSFLGKSRIVPPQGVGSPYFLEYYNPRETVSFYGVKVVEVLHRVSSARVVYLALNIVALFGLFKLKSNLQKITAFSLLAALLAFISASGILLGLRQKEIIALMPAYFLLLSIGLLSSLQFVRGRNRLPAAGKPRRRS